MKNPKDPRETSTQYEYLLAVDERLVVCFTWLAGKITSFSVSLLYLWNEEWECIKRCDSAHDGSGNLPHCHIYLYRKGELKDIDDRRVVLGDGDYAELLTQVLEGMKKQHGNIVEEFKRDYEQQTKRKNRK